MRLPRLMLWKQFFLMCFMCCLGSMLIAGCGIEGFVYLEKPQRIAHDPSNLEDLSQRYCEFTTADTANSVSVGSYFQGTEIYYRIYERKDDCENDKSQISQYNEDNPFTAAEYLEKTKKYYRLTTNQTLLRPLIGLQGSDATIRFRLQDYGSPISDPAQLTVNSTSKGVPQRDISILSSDKRAFNKDTIVVGDDDVQPSSVSIGTEEYWCVNFYAVSYGYTTTFSTIRSSLESLGYIFIKKS